MSSRRQVYRALLTAMALVALSVRVFPAFAASYYPYDHRPPECSDGIDNDRDNLIDFPEDIDCSSPHDNRELIKAPRSLTVHVSDGKQYAEPDEELVYRIVVSNRLGPDRVYTLETELHPSLVFLDATGYPHVDGRSVEWRNIAIEAGGEQEFLLATYVERDAPEQTVIQMRVSAGGSLGTDATSVLIKNPQEVSDVFLTDDRETASAGQEIAYTIGIRNGSSKLATEVDANFALPTYTEFVTATEGGHWTGKHVRWEGLTVSPHGERTLQVLLRVRRDTPLGANLRATVEARGKTAADLTTVGGVGSGRASLHRQPLELRKTADRSEVRPGDTVNFTIHLRNNTDVPLKNLLVQDRMDRKYMRVIGAQKGQMDGDRITWTIPVLAPGEEWTVRYSTQVNPNVAHGTVLKNVVSVTGDGMEGLSLEQRVYTGATGVIGGLPKAGADSSVLFLALTMLLGFGGTLAQRYGARPVLTATRPIYLP